ncbi:Uncharacterised protein [Mycobacteroides abscessus subsp. abscessus]|nr:Uncharacterised protein [Mycobacteroides abscessus subsp. abscessus]
MLLFALIAIAVVSFVVASVMIKPPANHVTRQPGFTEGYARGYEDGQSNVTADDTDTQPIGTLP